MSLNVKIQKELLLENLPEKGSKITSENLIKSLTKEQIKLLLDAVRPDSSDNPWRDLAVCYRNQLIVHMLLSTGCRKGELLHIKVTDFDHDEMSVKICMDSDNPEAHYRTRRNLSRKIMLPDDIYQMTDDYIMRFHSNPKGKNKSLNLFTSHAKGARKAEPLSLSSLDNTFNLLSKKLGFKVACNTLRQTWNDMFSKNMEQYRNYLMGCKPGSCSAQFITKSYQMVPTKAMMQISSQLQNKKHISDNK